jgi:hypothetical protein
MLTQARRARFETLRSLGFAGISGAYAAVGTAFSDPVRMLKVVNNTDANLIISYDGSTNQDYVAATSAFIYDFTSNVANTGDSLELAKGTTLYVKDDGVAPTSGSVYVVVIYASTN